MRRFPALTVILLPVLLVGAGPAWGQVNPIGPFSGSVFENFNVFPFDPSYQQYSIFGGKGLVKNTFAGGALKYEASSTRGGDTVLPRSAPTFGGQIGVSEWTFPQPLLRFGAYWENNSRFDDAVATFYDTNNNLVATLTVNDPKASQAWTWNGWQFDVPINKFVITGNDTEFFGGFIWWEDATANFVAAVPEPSTWLLICLALVSAAAYLGWKKWHELRRHEVLAEPESA